MSVVYGAAGCSRCTQEPGRAGSRSEGVPAIAAPRVRAGVQRGGGGGGGGHGGQQARDAAVVAGRRGGKRPRNLTAGH